MKKFKIVFFAAAAIGILFIFSYIYHDCNIISAFKISDIFGTEYGYDENNATVEIIMQKMEGGSLRFDENGHVYTTPENYCYYIGIDKNSNLYVRYGNGIPVLDYITEFDEETGKLYYTGYEDLIPEPEIKAGYKLPKNEYKKIVSILNQISDIYDGSKGIEEIVAIGMEFNYYKYYKFKGKYYNVQKAEILNPEVTELYKDLESVIFPYIGIEKYPPKKQDEWQTESRT